MSYKTDCLALSPVVYWRLGESAGTTAADETANANDGTYSNVVLSATGCLTGDANTSVRFDDDNNAKCEKSGASALPTGANAAWSIAFWHRTRSTVDLSQYFGFGSQPNSSPTNGTRREVLCFNAGGGTHYYFWGESADWDTGVNFHADSNPHFVVFTCDTVKSVNLYIDGSLAAGPHTVSPLILSGTYVAAGSHHPSGNSPNADIDECAVFAAELTSLQVAALYTAGTSPPPPPPPPASAAAVMHHFHQQGMA